MSYVSQIEAGRRNPSPTALAFFADRLGVTPDYLKTGIPADAEAALRYRLERVRTGLRTRASEMEDTVRSVLAKTQEYGFESIATEARAVLGDVLAVRGRIGEAIEAYEVALEGDLPQREKGRTVARLAAAYRSVGDLGYAADLLEGYVEGPESDGLDPSTMNQIHATLVSIQHEQGDVAGASRTAERALRSAQANLSLELRAAACRKASAAMAKRKRWDEALDLARRARVLLDVQEDRAALGRLHTAYALLCIEGDPPRLEEAREHLNLAERIMSESGDDPHLAHVYTERARLALAEGRPGDGIRYADQAISKTSGGRMETARALYLKAQGLSRSSRSEEARAAFREAAHLFEGAGARQPAARCWRELGELDIVEGAVEAALESLRRGLDALDPSRSRT